MENGLKELLENDILSDETKNSLVEAWNRKVQEVRDSLKEEVKTEVAGEFKARFEEDKNNLYLAMNDMLGEAVKKYATESGNEIKKLKEEKQKLTQAIKEARSSYKERFNQEAKVMENFVMSQLKDKMKELSEEKKSLERQRVTLARKMSESKDAYKAKVVEHMAAMQTIVSDKLKEELSNLKIKESELAEAKKESLIKLREHRIASNKLTAERINQLDKFVMEQLKAELVEFNQDKESLVEMKVKLATEAKAKISETQRLFIERASKLVESTVNSRLKSEMTRLKEDIRIARENTFARSIFEAFETEYMTSYMAEGTKIKKVSNQLDEAKAKLAIAEKTIMEQRKVAEAAIQKAKLSEGRALRAKTLSDLLGTLSSDKREQMAVILDTTRTEKLTETFHKYLPRVLNESTKPKVKQTLNEKVRVNTGNKPNRLDESKIVDSSANNEILRLRRLAGMK